MNKIPILFCMFLLILSSFTTAQTYETNENFTYTSPSLGTFTFNYPGFKNITNVSNSVYIWNGTVGVNYTLSAGESWALNQDPTTCVMPYEDMGGSSNTVTYLCKGRYGLHDANVNGVFYLNNNKMTYYGNNLTLFGNNTPNSIGIRIGSKQNVSIVNFTILGYTYDISNTLGGISNNISYVNFKAPSSAGFFSYSQKIDVFNCVFDNTSAYFAYTANGTFHDNTFINCNNASCGTRHENIRLDDTINMSIYNNYLDAGEVGVYINGNATNFYISNNTITHHDRGIRILNDVSGNGVIDSNIFINNTNNYDAYQLDIFGLNSNNIWITNNKFYESVDMSIHFQKTNNLYITGNEFNLICTENRSLYPGNGQNEPCTPVKIGQIFKTWNFYCSAYNSNCIENQTISDNITYFNNTFNNETIVYIYLEGVSNFSYSLPDYWYRSWAWKGFVGRSELYINNDKNEVRNFIRRYNITYPSPLFNNLYDMYNNNLTTGRVFGFIKTSSLFANSANVSTDLTIYNLTPPYNDILNSSNRVILASNQNTYSITLNPNQQIEVGDFPVVLTVLNHSILHDKFNVSITLDDSMNATLHVSTSASFTTYMNFSDSAFSTSHELQATGLSPGTLYYYQVNGTNSVGGEFNTTIYSVTTATTYCGDNIFQATNDESVTEQCDASDLNSQTCLSVGFTKGTLTCDSSCQFITTDCRIKSQMCQNNLVPLSGMATWLGLLVTIICIAFVFILFTNNSINLKLEGDAFYATILIVISVGFLLGVGILILSNLC